jgi:dUTP pyrophosphatase
VPTRPLRVVVERLDPTSPVRLPERATPGSVGFDLRAASGVRLTRGRVVRVGTGLRIRPPPGTFIEVRPRSGLSTKGVIMPNAPGTIDRDYADELQVPLLYLLPGSYRIEAGDRIAQARLVRDLPTAFAWGRVERVTSRSGGFGSTGR